MSNLDFNTQAYELISQSVIANWLEQESKLEEFTEEVEQWLKQAYDAGKADALAFGKEREKRLLRMTCLITNLLEITEQTQELNMSNFDVDDVEQLNNGFSDICLALKNYEESDGPKKLQGLLKAALATTQETQSDA